MVAQNIHAVGVTVKYTVNQGQLEALINSPEGGIQRDLDRRGRNVISRIRITAPRRTGRLANSFKMRTERKGFAPPGNTVGRKISSDLDYAIYQEFGTGIYAGRGYIHARPGRFLVWKDGGRLIFAKKVRGTPATHFLEKSLSAARD